eukprot:1283898-Heterocapsa_arctica.AAC.1
MAASASTSIFAGPRSVSSFRAAPATLDFQVSFVLVPTVFSKPQGLDVWYWCSLYLSRMASMVNHSGKPSQRPQAIETLIPAMRLNSICCFIEG